jgi:hypothetical protein
MESGLLAAEFVAAAVEGRFTHARLHEAYEAEFRRRFAGRYAAYQTAEGWVSSGWLLNLLAWRANSGRFVRRELESLIAERGAAERLFSRKGLLASIFQ